ncbi:ARM repeat-containing protein [Ramicandelaber brevisporus]|nr:ARM repeat-containing protein [Ramicandelaber brevisporus]
MSTPTVPAQFSWNAFFEKVDNPDSDYRYMALKDLILAMRKSDFTIPQTEDARLRAAFLKLVKDKNSEVQTQASRCLGFSVHKISETGILDFADNLFHIVANPHETNRDSAAVALKKVVESFPANSATSRKLSDKLVPKLTALLLEAEGAKAAQEVQVDVLDILTEVLMRNSADLARHPEKQTPIVSCLRRVQTYNRQVVRKRATLSLATLFPHMPNELAESVVTGAIDLFAARQPIDAQRTGILTLTALFQQNAERLSTKLSNIIPSILSRISDTEDDELRELCLQALEAIVVKVNATTLGAFLDEILAKALEFLKYDPNMAAMTDDESDGDDNGMDIDGDDDGDDDGDMMSDDGQSDEFGDDDEYGGFTDDEDVSWKVRRHSCRVISACVDTRPGRIGDVYRKVTPTLFGCIRDREESVRIEVIQAVTRLLTQTEGCAQIAPEGLQLLRQQIPRLVRILGSQMGPSATAGVRQYGFALLCELMHVAPQTLTPELVTTCSAVVAHGLSFGTQHGKGSSHAAAANANLKLSALAFARRLFTYQLPTAFTPATLNKLVVAITQSTSDRFFKVTVGVLKSFAAAIPVIRPLDASTDLPAPGAADSQHNLLLKVLAGVSDMLSASDTDVEVKNAALAVISRYIQHAGDVFVNEQSLQTVIEMVQSRVDNELTRARAIDALKALATSKTFAQQPAFLNILAARIPAIVQLCVGQLQRKDRAVRIASIETIVAYIDFAKVHGQPQVLGSGQDLTQNLVPALQRLLTVDDLAILARSLDALALLVNPAFANTGVRVGLQRVVDNTLIKLALSPLLTNTAAMNSLAQFWIALVASNPPSAATLAGQIRKSVLETYAGSAKSETIPAQARSAFAAAGQSIANIYVGAGASNRDTLDAATKALLQSVQAQASKLTSVMTTYLDLHTIGEIARATPIAQSQQPTAIVLALFESQSEDIRSAAAFVFGTIASSDLNAYLPSVLSDIRTMPTRRFLLLHSLKEILARFVTTEQGAQLGTVASNIWSVLFEYIQNGDENVRHVIGECLGRLVHADPERLLGELLGRAADPQPHIRGVVVVAIRSALTAVASNSTAGKLFESLLRPRIAALLVLIEDQDLRVRHSALLALNGIASNQPYLLEGVTSTLLPTLYRLAKVNPQYVRVVEMGPFKVNIDDAIEARQAAYHTIYTLIDTMPQYIEPTLLVTSVVEGITDVQKDAVLAVHQILTKLARIVPTLVLARADAIVAAARVEMDARPKETAMKQEFEKYQSIVESSLRLVAMLYLACNMSSGSPSSSTAAAPTSAATSPAQPAVGGSHQQQLQQQQQALSVPQDSNIQFPDALIAFLQYIRGAQQFSRIYTEQLKDLQQEETHSTIGRGSLGAYVSGGGSEFGPSPVMLRRANTTDRIQEAAGTRF